jgi:hypothetical protein
VTCFGANLNTGFYQTADIGKAGFAIHLRVLGMGTLIGDGEKTYSAVPPQPFAQDAVKTATVFGDEGTVVQGPVPGIDYHFQNGQIRATILPFVVPQLSVGNLLGTEAVIRYVPVPAMNDFPRTTLFGIGARHSISQYIPESPVALAAGIFYQKFTIGDIIDARAMVYSLQASVDVSMLTLYGGLQAERSTITLDYLYEGQNASVPIHLELEGENKFRATGGLSLNFVGINVNADISVGRVVVLGAGLGFGI